MSHEYFSSPSIKLPIPNKINGETLYAKEFLSSLLKYFESNKLKENEQLFAFPAFLQGRFIYGINHLMMTQKTTLTV